MWSPIKQRERAASPASRTPPPRLNLTSGRRSGPPRRTSSSSMSSFSGTGIWNIFTKRRRKDKSMRIYQVAYKNLLRKKVRSGLTLLGIALSAWVLVSLFGFNRGYERALNRDIDN